MRMWAEERKAGTIELLLTLPVTQAAAVVAKYLAAWTFAGVALVLTFPVWITVNYLGHPYFGATYYIRARERGFDRIDSFLYSAFASALYEFGVEAMFERPSYQDLIVTPVGGALLGGFVFEPIRNWVRRKPEIRWYDHVILIATDPIGALNYVAESLMGIKSDIRVGVPRRGGVFVEMRIPW